MRGLGKGRIMKKSKECTRSGPFTWLPVARAPIFRLACCVLGAWLLAVPAAYAVEEIEPEGGWLGKALEFEQAADNTQPETPEANIFITVLEWDEQQWTPDEVLLITEDETPYSMWDWGDGVWLYYSAHATQADLDQAFPSEATYKYIYSGGLVGPEELELELGPDAYPSDVPYFTGDVYTRARTAFDASSDFELTWNAFTPHAEAVHSFVEVLFENENTGEEIAWELDADATFFTVPAGTLKPGTPYAMEIMFSNVMSGEEDLGGTFFEKWTVIGFTTLANGMEPSGGVTVEDRRPEFVWPAVAGATWYQLWINRDGATYQSEWVEDSTTWMPDADLRAGNYSWWVRSWSPTDGHGEWSEAAEFLIERNIPSAVTQLGPDGPQDDAMPTYRWQKDAAATWYRLWVGEAGAGTWHDRWYELSGEGEASVTPDGAPPGPAKPILSAPSDMIANNRPTFEWFGGEWEWWIRPWGPDGYGPWSGPMAFSIPYPPNTWFRVYVNENSANVIDEWTTDDSLLSPVHLQPGTHSWWLGVWDAATGRTIWSDRMDFAVPEL